jgi:hypothetical protein
VLAESVFFYLNVVLFDTWAVVGTENEYPRLFSVRFKKNATDIYKMLKANLWKGHSEYNTGFSVWLGLNDFKSDGRKLQT